MAVWRSSVARRRFLSFAVSELGLTACPRRTSAYETWAEQIGRQSMGTCGLAWPAWAVSRVLLLFVRASPFAVSHESLTNRSAGV